MVGTHSTCPGFSPGLALKQARLVCRNLAIPKSASSKNRPRSSALGRVAPFQMQTSEIPKSLCFIWMWENGSKCLHGQAYIAAISDMYILLSVFPRGSLAY